MHEKRKEREKKKHGRKLSKSRTFPLKAPPKKKRCKVQIRKPQFIDVLKINLDSKETRRKSCTNSLFGGIHPFE